MKLVTLIGQAVWTELVGQRTGGIRAAPAARLAVGIHLVWCPRRVEIVALRDAKDHVAVAVAAVAKAGEHPAEDQILAGRTLADHERVASAVADVSQADSGRARPRCILHRDQNPVHACCMSRGRVDLVVLGGKITRIPRVGMATPVADTIDALVSGEGNRERATKLRNLRNDEGSLVGRTTVNQLLGAETNKPWLPQRIEAPGVVPIGEPHFR